jgi:hypothetical protein
LICTYHHSEVCWDPDQGPHCHIHSL